MKKLFYFILITVLSSSCKTEHFSPPCGNQFLISVDENENAYCLKDNTCENKPVEILPISACNNVMGVLPDYKNQLENFYQDKLTRLEICLISRKKCQ